MEDKSVKLAFCTTREAALQLGVSLRTAQLWVETGLLEAWKTEGGHRRISRASIERLIASTPPTDVGSPANSGVASERPLSILVVEDDATLRRLYEVAMSNWHIKPNVATAADGYAALIQMGYEKPDLLVTDLRMPGLDGFQMLRSIVAAPQLQGMEIVVVSGLDAHEIEISGGVPEGIPILPKPIPFERLQTIAERLLSARHQSAVKTAQER